VSRAVRKDRRKVCKIITEESKKKPQKGERKISQLEAVVQKNQRGLETSTFAPPRQGAHDKEEGKRPEGSGKKSAIRNPK